MDGELLLNTRCTVCHTRARIDEEDEDLDGWTEIVNRMQGYGAQLSDRERDSLIAYLVATHGDADDDHDDDSGKGRGRGGDDEDDHDDDSGKGRGRGGDNKDDDD